jgi:hypothetical protein
MIYDPSTKSYSLVAKSDVKDRIDVEVGDSKDASTFQPQVKLMRWDNEVNFSVRLANVVLAGATYSQTGDVITWQKGDIISRFYSLPVSEIHPEGGYEFEVILNSKPTTNVIQMSMETKSRFLLSTPS